MPPGAELLQLKMVLWLKPKPTHLVSYYSRQQKNSEGGGYIKKISSVLLDAAGKQSASRWQNEESPEKDGSCALPHFQ